MSTLFAVARMTKRFTSTLQVSTQSTTVSRLLLKSPQQQQVQSVAFIILQYRHCIGHRLRPRQAIDRRGVSNPRPGPTGPDWAQQRFGPVALILSRRRARHFTPAPGGDDERREIFEIGCPPPAPRLAGCGFGRCFYGRSSSSRGGG